MTPWESLLQSNDGLLIIKQLALIAFFYIYMYIYIYISSTTGIFPDKLQVAKVILIHKVDSKKECFNYRPVSLLSNIGEVIGKLIRNR